MDLDRLHEAAIDKAGPANVSFVRMEATTNLIGGQPFLAGEPAPGEGARSSRWAFSWWWTAA